MDDDRNRTNSKNFRIAGMAMVSPELMYRTDLEPAEAAVASIVQARGR
jgi:hypothetical protein